MPINGRKILAVALNIDIMPYSSVERYRVRIGKSKKGVAELRNEETVYINVVFAKLLVTYFLILLIDVIISSSYKGTSILRQIS